MSLFFIYNIIINPKAGKNQVKMSKNLGKVLTKGGKVLATKSLHILSFPYSSPQISPLLQFLPISYTPLIKSLK